MFKRGLIIATAFISFLSTNAQAPKGAQAVYQQGIAFMNKSQYPDAMASFFKAVALYKNYDSAWVQMGDINVKFSSFDTAVSFYKKALAINPKYLQALINLAAVYKNYKNDINGALDCYFKAIAIDSTNKETFLMIAWCYNSLKDYDNAIAFSVKALQLDNNYRLAYSEMAHAFHFSGRFAEGIVQFKKNIVVLSNELSMFYVGLCYIELKDKAGATSMLNQLTKISSKLADRLKEKIDKM